MAEFEALQIRCLPHLLYYHGDPWFKLDGVIQKAAFLDHYGEAFYSLPPVTPATPAEDLIVLPLPLEKRERYGTWYYACSWVDVRAATLSHYTGAWVRRFSEMTVRYWGDHRGRGRFVVHTGKGADKAVHQPIPLRVVRELAWYAVGDVVEIKRLLETYAPAIGKKQAQGWGQLCEYADGSRWRVEPWSHDWSERLISTQSGPQAVSTGMLTRGIPAREGGRWYPVRPPYYVRANRARLLLPQVSE